MKGATWAVGGLGAATLVLPVILAGAIGGQSPALQTLGSGTLNTALVSPQYVALVEQAGAMCPDESAPLIAAQIQAESAWNPTAVSPAGAQGIAQFMPGTWATWGKDYDHNGSASALDPGDAIPSQGALMCELFAEANAALKSGRITHGTAVQNALAGYNAGMGNVYASGGFPTGITETDNYVPTIIALAQTFTVLGATGGSAGGAAAVAAAEKYLGYPYIWGAGDTRGPTGYLWSAGPPVGFDCEGLVRYATFQGFHVDIGAGTTNQLVTSALKTVATRTMGQPYPLAAMAPGDVVLINFHPSSDGAWGHVALYLGGGRFIHAPHTGDVVKVVQASAFDTADWVVRRIP